MFTGIVQGISTIASIRDAEGLRTFTIDFSPGFIDGLAVGASVSVDGVCLTVTQVLSVVDTVRASVAETLGNLRPALEAFLAQRGVVLEDLIAPVTLPR